MTGAAASNALHPLLHARFSPLSFDPDHRLTDPEIDVLLEAARWAPSAGNSQPWGFVTARREQPAHENLVGHLAASSRRWAASASALLVNIAHRHVDDTALVYSEFADYDLGQAVAHLTIQAQAMGLACRQFRAFDLASLSDDLQLAPGWAVVSMTAVGLPASEKPTRDRRNLDELRNDVLAR